MFTTTAQTQPYLDKIKSDYEEMKNRQTVAMVMRANGFSESEVQETMQAMKKNQSDLADMILEELLAAQ